MDFLKILAIFSWRFSTDDIL